MQKLSTFIASLTITTTAIAGGWKLRDLDPFNRHAGIRRTASELDPFAALGRIKGRLISVMAREVSHDPVVRSKARTEGWTLNKCRLVLAGVAAPVIVFKSTAICAAFAGAEPISTGTCATTLTASAATITEIACTQLCNDRILRDCR